MKRVWIHCASAGEYEQAIPLIRQLRNRPDTETCVSFFSVSGIDFYYLFPEADHCFLLPLDSPAEAAHLLDVLQPDAVCWVRYEFWFFYLQTIAGRKIPLYLIFANTDQLQDKHFFYRKFIYQCLDCFTHIYTLKKSDSFPFQHSAVLDGKWIQARNNTLQAFNDDRVAAFKRGSPLLIYGSLHLTDMHILLPALPALLENQWKVLIVPHETDVDTVKAIKKQLKDYSIGVHSSDPDSEASIMIIAKKGVLKFLYRYAEVAFIGGGFGKCVHNVSEAAAYGIGLLSGPKTEGSSEAVDFQQERLLTVCNNADQLKAAISAFEAEEKRQRQKAKLKALFERKMAVPGVEVIASEIIARLNQA